MASRVHRLVVFAFSVVVTVVCAGATCPQTSVRQPRGPIAPLVYVMPQPPVCERDYGEATDVAAVLDAALLEVSGLATSVQNSGLVWAIADAGNASAVYGLSTSTGNTRLVINLPVDNIDFEDIATGPCPDLSGPCVYVGDTGDNDRVRNSFAVYAFGEPKVDETTGGVITLDAVWQLPLAFPDGESVDVEAFAVYPDASAMVFVEKTLRGEARIFVAASPWIIATDEDTAPGVVEVTGSVVPPVDDLAGRVVSGASFHWSGTRLLLRFAAGLAEYDADNRNAFFDLHASTPRQVLVGAPSEGGRGEAVSYDGDGTSILTVAEANVDEVPVLHRMGCP